jgi:hypothetical protein
MTRNETWVALYAAAVGGIVAARAKDEKHFFGMSVGKEAADIANAAYLYVTSSRHEEMAEDAGFGKQQRIDELKQEIVQLKEQIIQERRVARLEGKHLGITGEAPDGGTLEKA